MSKNVLKLVLKLLLTGLALFLVFRKIDIAVTWSVIKAADGLYLLLAALFFILSKIVSSFRLHYFFADVGLHVPTVQNIKLYGIGMFYNLFLPGGIGGDGYKVYLLNKFYKAPVKKLLSAVLLDRINGLAVLVFLMFFLFLSVEIEDNLLLHAKTWGWVGIIIVPVAFYGLMYGLFRRFMGSMAITLTFSFFVQLLQLICAYCILLALGIAAQVVEYLFVFLLSSIVAVLPLTIGGVGARELVFIFSHDYMGIDQNAAVAFSLLFFMITALTALTGVFMKFSGERS